MYDEEFTTLLIQVLGTLPMPESKRADAELLLDEIQKRINYYTALRRFVERETNLDQPTQGTKTWQN